MVERLADEDVQVIEESNKERDMFKKIVDNSPEPVMILEKSKIIFMNKA